MIEYRGFKANKHRLYETEPGVKLEFRGPDADMFAQVRAPKHPVKVVTFDLTEQEYWNLLFGEKCQRAGCERITIPAYCSHECRELDSQPLPPLVHHLTQNS